LIEVSKMEENKKKQINTRLFVKELIGCVNRMKMNCECCEFSYFKRTGRGCQWEDYGVVVPETLRDSRRCPYWELRGNVWIDFNNLIFKEGIKKPILCEKCKKQIGEIEEDAMVIDGEFGHIGIMIYCKDCKKETFEYENNMDRNALIEKPEEG